MVSAQETWPKFRGPQGNGHAAPESNPPTTWSTSKNIRWRVDTPGQGWSSPVIAGNKIFLSAAIPTSEDEKSDFNLCLLIYNADDGKLIRNVTLMQQRASKTPRIHKKNTHASPTPIINNDRVYVHFGYQGTACTDLDGNKLWENRDLFFKPTHGNGGSPVLVDGRLVFTCDGGEEPKVVALDAATGKLAWETPRPLETKKTFSFCTPAVITVDGQKQVIAPGSDCVLALNPADGKTIWDVRYTGYSVVPKPIFADNRVYVSTSFDNAKLLAIRPNGTGIVTDTHVDWIIDRNISKTPSLIAHAGLIYSVSDSGIAQCAEAKTGDVVYKQRVGGGFSASPFIARDRIYFTDEAGKTTVVKAGREYKELASNDLGERPLASAALLGNSIILRTDKALYRIAE